MLQYKTVVIPVNPYSLKKNEYRSGRLSVEKANEAVAPLGKAIEQEARGGWRLHSIQSLPQRMVRKKSILELLLGWIPFVGRLLFPTMHDECYSGEDWYLHVMTFVKEKSVSE